MDLEWRAPEQTFGPLKGYRVRYGRLNQEKLIDILITDPNVQHQEISGLEKGIEYEFRVAGVNNVGPGQEFILPYLTPEGVPTDSPKNITWLRLFMILLLSMHETGRLSCLKSSSGKEQIRTRRNYEAPMPRKLCLQTWMIIQNTSLVLGPTQGRDTVPGQHNKHSGQIGI